LSIWSVAKKLQKYFASNVSGTGRCVIESLIRVDANSTEGEIADKEIPI